MKGHDVELRAPAFLGGGPEPVVIRRTDQRFLEGLFRDLKTRAGRAEVARQVLPQQDEDDAVLYLPTHRCFNLVLAEAYCDVPGKPRVAPERIESSGLVVRRRLATRNGLGNAQRWLVEEGRVVGWSRPEEGELEEDPSPPRRRQLGSGNAAVDVELAARRAIARRGSPGPFEEKVTQLFVAPPAVCEALGTTLLFGVVEPTDTEVPEPPLVRPETGGETARADAAAPRYSDDEIGRLLPVWLRARSPAPAIPASVAGRTFRVRDASHAAGLLELQVERKSGSGWGKFTFPEPWRHDREEDPDATDLKRFLRMLWQVRIQLAAFDRGTEAKALRKQLRAVSATLPDASTVTLEALIRDASDVFILLEEGAEVTFPSTWPTLSEGAASAVKGAVKASLERQLQRLATGEQRYARDRARYEIRAFVRVDPQDGCPPQLRWSVPTSDFRVAKWFEGGPDDAALPVIELPTLDRGFLKTLRPNVSLRVPRSMFNFLNNNDPKDLVGGDAKNDTRGPAIQWICSFNFSIIFMIAFMLLISFVFMLNIVFWWVAFFRICIPLPAGGGDDE